MRPSRGIVDFAPFPPAKPGLADQNANLEPKVTRAQFGKTLGDNLLENRRIGRRAMDGGDVEVQHGFDQELGRTHPEGYRGADARFQGQMVAEPAHPELEVETVTGDVPWP